MNILKKYPIDSLVITFGSLISFFGFFFGKAFITIGVIIIFLSLLFNKGFLHLLSLDKKNTHYYALIVFFTILLASGFWSDDTAVFKRAIIRKLPLLLIPIAFLGLQKLNKQLYLNFLKGYFIIISLINLYLFKNNFLDIDILQKIYQEGRVISTPMMHIRYSLLCAYNVFVGCYLLQKLSFKKWEQLSISLGVIFGFIFIHLLAVRTGMAALYCGVITTIIGYIISSKKYVVGIGLSLIMACGLTIAVNNIPTLKNKWNYTIFSIQEMQNNHQIERLSDSYRLGSIGAGIEIGNSAPITGVGLGDVKPLTIKYVQQHYPQLAHDIFTPQSQYVMAYASLGIIGLLIFCFATIQPILLGWRYFDINAIGFHAIIVGSYIVEQTLETQLGTAIAIIFGSLSYKFMIDNNQNIADKKP